MARFDVYRAAGTYLLDCQSALLNAFDMLLSGC
jgi:hypothetical protein